ncbi:MAG TPA: hypothetical protein VFL59_15720, partial [Candidatus Nanopelagicales bacterium]|nr:hypothetical protein [Candidatus Nanopelagicales bacterium]
MTDAPLQGLPAPSIAGRDRVLSACVGALALVVTVLATYLLGRAVVVPLVNPVESLGAVVMAVLGLVLIVSAVVAVGAWWLLRRRGVPRAGAIALGGAVVLPGAAFLATGGETWMLVAAPLLAGAGWYVVALASAR